MSVVPRLRSLASVRAKTMGIYVPKSPIAPFTSNHLDRKARLFLTFWRVVAAKPDNGLGLSMVWQGWDSMEGDWYMMLRMKTDEENK